MESTTRLVTIPDYSKLVRLPAAGSPQLTTLETFHFCGHVWRVKVYAADTGSYEGISSYLSVFVVIADVRRQQSRSASGTKISIEILDESGEHTVFDKEQTLGNDAWSKFLMVPRRELEASWCIRNDSFTVRCTLSLHTGSLSKPKSKFNYLKRLRSFFKPTMILKEPKVVLAGSHTLMIDSFSKHKAAFRALECVRSTRFCVGRSTWSFKLRPNGYYNSNKNCHMSSTSLVLTRTSSHEPATMAEFNFELLAGDDGGKYHEFTKVTCTFDRASREHAQPVPSTSTAKRDRFIVRCCLAVIKAEMLMPRSESDLLTPLLGCDDSLLTPLLGCHDVRSA